MEPHEEFESEHSPALGSSAEEIAPETGLFYASLLRDPIALVGFGFVALSSWGGGSGRSAATPLLTEEPIAGAIDLAIGALIIFALFGLVPAAIRRKVRAGKGSTSRPLGPRSSIGRAILVALVIGVVSMLVGETMGELSASPGSSSQRPATSVAQSMGDAPLDERSCQRVGTDEKCVRVQAFNRSDVRLTIDWNYSPPRAVGLEELTRLQWQGSINCVARTSRLGSLTAYSGTQRIILPDFALTAMRDGIRNEQLPALLEYTC